MKTKKLLEEMRRLFADYVYSEGCECCQDIKPHDVAANKLGKLLDVEKYDDDSGYNFSKYRTK